MRSVVATAIWPMTTFCWSQLENEYTTNGQENREKQLLHYGNVYDLVCHRIRITLTDGTVGDLFINGNSVYLILKEAGE